MKKLFLLLVVSLLSFSMNAQTFINEKLNGKVDFKSNKISLTVMEIPFSGVLDSIKYKYNYLTDDYYMIKGEEYQLLVSFDMLRPTSKYSKISELFLIEGGYDNVYKNVKENSIDEKDIIFKYNSLYDSSKEKDLNSDWVNQNHLKKEEELKNKYFSLNNLEKFEGKYKLKIFKVNNIDYSKYNQYGEMFLTNSGFTFKSEIPSISLIRKPHYINENFLPYDEGSFILGSNNDIMILSINLEGSVGSFSYRQYGKTYTTIFIIKEFID